ncbi:hypothetical protein ZYGR_0AL01020 [Zygosaccharomyces rouxii]|uniref:ATP synthase subunit g, mitochondrial n=1 Tax=Zygosaccharomyces rouxii TaxID=4956 RepID=A0A1Q3AFE5_ZYGRO|nr:hypothetical protein ZYGR_0AL01020 [Zygosaccharomyces rouxii]
MLGRIQSITTGLLSKTGVLATKTVYYGKVGAELSKQVYLKERLQPPSIDEFKRAYVGLYQRGLFYASRPKDVINLVKAFKKDDYIKYTAFFVQLLGFYSVGEIIGRRKLVGYKDYNNHH